MHADAVGNANVAHLYKGTVSFGTQVLALATTDSDLRATQAVLGNPAVGYPTNTGKGLEYNDKATILGAGSKADLTFNVYNVSDEIRIITIAP